MNKLTATDNAQLLQPNACKQGDIPKQGITSNYVITEFLPECSIHWTLSTN